MMLTLCHYPMVTWKHKPYGSIMPHGHCHGNLDEHNRLSNDLRFDVGIDGDVAKRAGEFVPLELIYEDAMEKTGGVPFHQYAKLITTYGVKKNMYVDDYQSEVMLDDLFR